MDSIEVPMADALRYCCPAGLFRYHDRYSGKMSDDLTLSLMNVGEATAIQTSNRDF